MRMMLRISMPTEGSNRALKEGLVQKLVQQTVEALRPEACYFMPVRGERTALFFFDMKDSSQMPAIAEPWYMATNARIDVQPVMNADELRAGLDRIPR